MYQCASCSVEASVRRSIVSWLLLTCLPCAAFPQRLTPTWVPKPAFASPGDRIGAQVRDSVDHSGSRAAGGLLGAAIGTVVGGVLGEAIERPLDRSTCEDFCGIGGLVFGGMLGESFGMVGGMALAGPGSRPVDLLISTGLALAGFGAAALTNQPFVLVAVPIAQLVVLLAPDRKAAAEAPPN